MIYWTGGEHANHYTTDDDVTTAVNNNMMQKNGQKNMEISIGWQSSISNLIDICV
jgi:hypothetical protein